MRTPVLSRAVRDGFAIALGVGILAVVLFGSVTVGVGLTAGFRERVLIIMSSANDAMAAVGINAEWRALAWSGLITMTLATLALIWFSLRMPDDGE
jgi:hypothetical protein